MSDDLWGELPIGDNIETPYSILVEQGGELYRKTGYQLRGTVEKSLAYGTLVVKFEIVAPYLENYSYEVLSCSHSATAPYPAEVNGATGESKKVNSPEELKLAVAAIFQSSRVKHVINGLLTQA